MKLVAPTTCKSVTTARPRCNWHASRPTLKNTSLNSIYANSFRRINLKTYAAEASEETSTSPEPTENGSSSTTTATTEQQESQIMSMAASLIERAQEVATSGTVDESFTKTFVDELKAELESLEQRAKSAEASATAFEDTLKSVKEQFVRLSADFDNFRKRTSTERDVLKDSVKGDTIMAMLPLIDNFELAKSQLKLETDGEKKIDAAYQGLYKQMVELFRGLGLEAVSGAGSPFDPEVHEAIMREPSEDVPDGTVLEEFRKGFKLGERLLRPAMVKVSFSEGGSNSAEGGEEQEGGEESE